MSLTFQDLYTKAEFLSGQNDSATLTQLKQDINVGYARFNAQIARYFTRKQSFTDIVAGQQYYQTPIDSVRVMEVSTKISGGFEFAVEQIRSEHRWRQQNIVQFKSTYAIYYYVVGNDQIGIWPIPSQNVTAGLRFVYQPQDVAMTLDDYNTGTVTVTNGSTTVTGSGTTWLNQYSKMQLQVIDDSDGNFYDVDSVASATSINLKTPYVGTSGSGKLYRLGQVAIYPPEYDDVPVDYALARFYESRNNAPRAKYHRDNYNAAVTKAVEEYSSSSVSTVVTDNIEAINLWYVPPVPGA